MSMMNTYAVFPIQGSEAVWGYNASTLTSLDVYPLDQFEHRVITTPAAPAQADGQFDFLIDRGPFYDRFGAAKMMVLTSEDPIVRGFLSDVGVRGWIDLKNPDVVMGVKALMAKVPEVTGEIVDAVLNRKVAPEHNLILRKLYF